MSLQSGLSQLGLPWQGSTPAVAHASWTGARAAEESRGQQTARYLALVKSTRDEGLTDHEAAARLALPLSSINSIRHGLGPCVVDALNPQRIEREGTTRRTQRTRWRWSEPELG